MTLPPSTPDDWNSSHYRQFRPRYPDTLFDWLAAQAPDHRRALDCGCGTGQATRPLAARFGQVVACDLVPAQLAALEAPAHCQRVVASSAALPFAEASMSVITVAQALHWFDLPAFHREATRLLVPGGLLAVWTYGLCEIDGACGPLVRAFHDHTLRDWWAPNRTHVVNGYRDLPLPWPLLDAPTLTLRYDWHWRDMLGYLGTWSAVIAARAAGKDVLEAFAPRLAEAWGDGTREVRGPLHLRVARKPE